MTTDPDPDRRTALLARLRSLEGVLAMWDRNIRETQACLGVALGQRDKAQAELAAVRQDLARLEREGVAG